MKPSDFHVGQTLFYVSNRSSSRRSQWVGEQCVVTGIGRKWVTAKPGGDSRYFSIRFDAKTMLADGGEYPSPGTFYLSEAAYLAEVETKSAWVAFRASLPHTAPPHLDADKINALAATIRGEA